MTDEKGIEVVKYGDIERILAESSALVEQYNNTDNLGYYYSVYIGPEGMAQAIFVIHHESGKTEDDNKGTS